MQFPWKLDNIYRQTREVILCPAMSGVTLNHMHNKSNTFNTNIVDLVHTCRTLSRRYIGESTDTSESIRNAVCELHDCIMPSIGMHLSLEPFKVNKYPGSLSKSSKSSWTKFPGYVWHNGVT